jgi:hypothetical protein
MLYKLSRKYKYVRLPRSWVDTYAVEPVIKNFSKFRKKKKNPRWTRYIARYSGRRRPRDRKLHRFLVIYFKILPFLIEFKRFILKTLIKLFNPGLVKIYLLSITKYRSITAKYILWFVEKFLRRYRRIKKMKKVFYKLVKYLLLLKKKFKLRGFKFLLAGRFFRRNRAIYIWRTYGAVPLATKLSKIDFAVKTMQMKYSKPIVKLWICRA